MLSLPSVGSKFGHLLKEKFFNVIVELVLSRNFFKVGFVLNLLTPALRMSGVSFGNTRASPPCHGGQ